jgi:predicted DNA-binding transcriptional regulator AlpA
MPKLMTIPDAPPGASVVDRLVPVPEVRRRLGNISRQHLYELSRAGEFPAPIHVGSRIYWSEWEISAWIDERKAARRHAR